MTRNKLSLVPEKGLPPELPDPHWSVTPDEGRALINAFLRVHDRKLRADIIAHIEKIAATAKVTK